MASSGGFVAGFAWRMLALLGALAACAWTLATPGLVAARIVAATLVAGMSWQLWHHIGRTNRELARFVGALRHGDLTQSFRQRGGGGFAELGHALDTAIRALRAERIAAADEARVQAALADEAPAALLLVDGDARVTLANKAARRLFHRLDGTRVEDFVAYGAELVALLAAGEAGARKVVPLRVDGLVQRAMVSRASLDRLGQPLGIVAVQPIQGELSTVELAAQADLVRVLTHEIMNSMTPVVSLAESAARLMARIDATGDADLADAHAAVATLARRASGIMHFVESYRAFSRAPVVQRRRFAALPWATELQRLFGASAQGRGVALALTVEPADLVIDADPDLLAQVAINLLKNGAEAAAAQSATPHVALGIALLPGGRTRISIADDGPGIAPGMADEIFLPFFTTKPDGTGVGLSLARRIMIAHGGAIALGEAPRGALFELTI